jgi:hypothetical protein
MAWYENSGPSASQVRQDVFEYIYKKKDNITPLTENIMQEVVLKIIPDTRNDFGSYRGYSTFNITKKIALEVIKEVEIQEVEIQHAISILTEKFTPYVRHYLYKPNGIRMKQVAETTLVGKSNK